MSKSIDRSTRDCSNPNVSMPKNRDTSPSDFIIAKNNAEIERLKKQILIENQRKEIAELNKKISDKQKQNSTIPSMSKYDPQCSVCHDKKCEYIRSGKLCQHGRRWKNNYGVCDNFNKCPTW